MPSNFSRSFRRSNYRAFIDKSLWLTAWRSVKRVHKDKRARKHLLLVSAAILLLALVLAGCFVYLLFVIGTGAWLFLPFAIPVTWWIRRGAKKEFAPMNITPRPEPLTPTVSNDRSKLISYFSKLAILYAVLVDRAGSESYIKQKDLPEGTEVVTRRTHLELLKSAGIWENLAPQDREAIMMGDGDWDWSRINEETAGLEAIRVLRWILRIDFCLPLVALQVSTDFSIAHNLVVDARAILSANDLVEVSAIPPAREQAHIVLLRCLAESINRGYIIPDNPQMIAWAKGVSASLEGNQNEDFLIGDQLVSETSESQLSWALNVAKTRHEFLSFVESLMSGDLGVPDNFGSIFAGRSAKA